MTADRIRVKLGLLFIALLLSVGCSGQRIAPKYPTAVIVAFTDGFHSGVMVPRQFVPIDLLPPTYGEALRWPWVVLHFGERHWIRGEADSMWDAVRLSLATGDGGVQIDLTPSLIHACGGTRPEHVRVWVFPVTQRELTELLTRFRSWTTVGVQQELIGPTTGWWPSTRHWSLPNNCHDFTADLLAGAGIQLPRPPIMSAWGLADALDDAWVMSEGSR